ncbi:hypothetical protein E2C01_014743 [Portunus trituberculatus]|uniref:Uncharacterized protein n=1 Tax=Portunus trituberculatus TaxID=210409 RepID=A0A5B7DK13_PORTR|nr:hypothetical protein [Portunus trituberculatus]
MTSHKNLRDLDLRYRAPIGLRILESYRTQCRIQCVFSPGQLRWARPGSVRRDSRPQGSNTTGRHPPLTAIGDLMTFYWD